MRRRRTHLSDTQAPNVSQMVLGRFGPITGFFVWFFVKWAKISAFSLRVFLRDRLGERTFSPVLIFLSFAWIRYFLDGDLTFKTLDSSFYFFSFGEDLTSTSHSVGGYLGWLLATWIWNAFYIRFGVSIPFIAYAWDVLDMILWPVYCLVYLIIQFLQNIDRWYTFILTSHPDPQDVSETVFYFSLLFLCFAILHFLFTKYRNLQKKNILHSNSRGNSTLFFWLENKKIGSFTITKTSIALYVEPLFVLLLGYLIFIKLGIDRNIGFFLLFSAIGLFFEEYWELQLLRRNVLNIRDGEIDGDMVLKEYQKYYDQETDRRNNFSSNVKIF